MSTITSFIISLLDFSTTFKLYIITNLSLKVSVLKIVTIAHCKEGIVRLIESLLFQIEVSEQNSLVTAVKENHITIFSAFLHILMTSW